MTFLTSWRKGAKQSPSAPEIDRRSLVVGAGIAGAAAIATAALHRQTIEPTIVAADKPKTREGDGYQVTPHVLRYYETTRS
ncbi:MAG: formate dehydrogenase [Caldimonas sp.]